MNDVVERLKEPETYYSGNFDTPKRANAMLSCLCQEAAEEIESLRHQLEMAEACLAGDNALIVGLKNDIAEKDEEIDSYKTSYESTHAQNLRLADQLGESVAEIERLKAENRKLALDCLSADGQALEHWQQLASSQAREMQLREALASIEKSFAWIKAHVGLASNEALEGYSKCCVYETKDVLALQTDTTALQAMITKAGEVMRERCLEDIWYMPKRTKSEIRALPPITLKDLE